MMELKISLFSWINWTNQGTCWIISFKSMPLVGYKKYQRTRVTIRDIEAESGRDEERMNTAMVHYLCAQKCHNEHLY